MKTAYVVSGQLTEEGRIELDERVPLPAGRVRVSVEVAEPAPTNGIWPPAVWVDEQEWKRRKADMNSALGCISDEEAQEILAVIEEEFEQVNPDDWR